MNTSRINVKRVGSVCLWVAGLILVLTSASAWGVQSRTNYDVQHSFTVYPDNLVDPDSIRGRGNYFAHV